MEMWVSGNSSGVGNNSVDYIIPSKNREKMSGIQVACTLVPSPIMSKGRTELSTPTQSQSK